MSIIRVNQEVFDQFNTFETNHFQSFKKGVDRLKSKGFREYQKPKSKAKVRNFK